MTPNRYRLNLILGMALFAACLFIHPINAGEPACFKAQLIWGTNHEKLDNPKLTKVDSKLVERLKRVFKWEYYYRVKEKDFCVPAKKSKRIELTEKCHLLVRDLGKPMVEVKLFGQGKLVNKITQAAIKCLVIAGDDRNDTAWFVVLIPQ